MAVPVSSQTWLWLTPAGSGSPWLTLLPVPLWSQVIKAVLKDASDTTQLSLLYANVAPDDILLREELDGLAAQHPNFKVWYTGEACRLRRLLGGT